MLRSLTAWWLTLWKLCWFSGVFLLITTEGLLFRLLGDDADFLFWRFATCNRPTWPIYRLLGDDADFLFWRFATCNRPTWPTFSLLGSSTVRRLNLFDVLIWKYFTGFFRFTMSFCKGEFNLFEHLFGFWSYHTYKDNCYFYYYQNYTCFLLS